jgi:hypothetical protein
MTQLNPRLLKVTDYGLSDNPIWEDLEPNIKDAIVNYLLFGFEPGSFTTGLLANDLYRAIGSAHPGVLDNLKEIVTWVNNVLPSHCYGDYDTVTEWLQDANGIRSSYVREVEKRYVWRQLNEKANDYSI